MKPSSLLDPGHNCWRVEEARRAAVLIDAADYFRAVARAVERARRSVIIVGWDIHSQLRLIRDEDETTDRYELRTLLDRAARRGVDVRVLTWDFSLLFALEREPLPVLQLDWRTHPNLQVELASDHPPGGCHHQKVVVVDDALAFSGGIDLTAARWDERAHRPDDPRRETSTGDRYGPFHDVQMAVDGEAAAALGDLVRERWRQATGEALDAPRRSTDGDDDPWPPQLEPTFRRVRVGIARTQAEMEGREAHREVERLFLDSIAAAQEVIYVENQYLTAPALRDALADRLGDEQGPEVVVMTPRDQSGRLEELTMGELRRQWVSELERADVGDRLRVWAPLAEADRPINVHAKVMVIDDDWLRVGSANFSRRSLHLDSECDLAIEAGDDEAVAQAILGVRNDLLAEHLDRPVEEIEEALQTEGSLIAAIEKLDRDGRRLPPLRLVDRPSSPVGAELADPAEPLDEALARYVLPPEPLEEAQRRWPRLLAVVALFLAMAAAWAYTPLEQWVEPSRLSSLVSPLVDHELGWLFYALGAATVSLVGVPITALIVTSALLFGPWLGATAAGIASLASAAAGYGLGRLLLQRSVEDLLGQRFERINQALDRRGVLSVVAVRIVPIAPYVVVNVVAGSSRVAFGDFMIGTFLGMVPGIVGLSFAADRIAAAVRSPSVTTIAMAAVVVATLAAALGLLRHWLRTASSPAGRSES